MIVQSVCRFENDRPAALNLYEHVGRDFRGRHRREGRADGLQRRRLLRREAEERPQAEEGQQRPEAAEQGGGDCSALLGAEWGCVTRKWRPRRGEGGEWGAREGF